MMTDESEGTSKEVFLAYSRYYPGKFSEELSKISKILIQESDCGLRCPSRAEPVPDPTVERSRHIHLLGYAAKPRKLD
jgi:hypothetical protein